MKVKYLFGGIVAAVILLCASFTASAAAKVNVILPEYPIVINGTRVENFKREYPFISYKDITYFPMTYHDCDCLGVKNSWTFASGNIITVEKSKKEYYDYYSGKTIRSKKAVAEISENKIYVNGIRVSNSSQEYPILFYKDVLYFPLTWDWCMEFGWKISFDTSRGLSLSSNGEPNIGEYKVPTQQDYDDLAKLMEYIYYSMADNDYNYYGIEEPNAPMKAYNIVMGKNYPYLYASMYDVDGTLNNSDPKRKYRKAGSYKLPQENVKFIINDVLNTTVSDETFADSYYSNKYYHRKAASEDNGIGLVEIRKFELLKDKGDGTYALRADVYSYDTEKTNLWRIGYISVVAGVKVVDGERYWSINKIDLTDYDLILKAEEFDKIIDKAINYATTVSFKPEEVLSVDYFDGIYLEQLENGRKYYKVFVWLDIKGHIFSPEVKVYIDTETWECMER